MRIVIVVSGLGLGGAERQVVLVSREFARMGHEVLIYLLNSSETERVEELAGTPVRVVVDQKRSKLDPGVLRRLRRAIVDFRADVVHGWLHDGNLYSRLAAIGTGATVINSERNDNYAVARSLRLAFRLSGALVHGLIANSHSGAAFARRLHRLAEQDTAVVWNGIDLAEVDRRIAAAGRPAVEACPGEGLKRVCIVGSIKPQKDHGLAFRTLQALLAKDPSWRLLCIGDAMPTDASGYKGEVLALGRTLGLQDRIHYTGYRRDVMELMASCDVVLVTSHHEGFPNVVLEAMACGAPVASTEYSDVRRILPLPWQVDGTRDPAALARIVQRCHAERDAVVRAQRHWVEEHASSGSSARNMLAVYRALAARRRREPVPA